jgi:branched-chain amino acid transport system substrate-binding protein
MLKTLEYNIKPERGDSALSNSKALAKTQSIILITVIVVASVSGIAYFLMNTNTSQVETIRIGVVGDIDMVFGKSVLQGAILAAEEVNAEGGILGKQFEVIAEDSDSEGLGADISVGVSALNRLITNDEADCILTPDLAPYVLPYQDIVAEHKKILIGVRPADDELTQRVVDDYGKYKYFFRVFYPNATSAIDNTIDCLLTLRNYTGFNKIGYLAQDLPIFSNMLNVLDEDLPEVYGFDLAYKGRCPSTTTDFTSYLAAAEAAGVEVLYPMIANQAGIPLVKEWYDRQSPFVLWGVIGVATADDFWNVTDGKCEDLSLVGVPVTSGFPLTSKTVPLHDAYFERWGEAPDAFAASAYDAVRYILYDAISRAGTTETDAVVIALEKTNVETSMARNFVFTSSHDVMVGEAGLGSPEEDYMMTIFLQWQEGKMVPVYPAKIMQEAGVTYTYPDWPGPWGK